MIPKLQRKLAALLLLCAAMTALRAADSKRAGNTIVLNEAGLKNLRIETLEVEETAFEETVFALGRIEVLPGKKAVVSSRIPGRASVVLATPDQEVKEGEELISVESRQPGDPPPTIRLTAPIAGTIAKVDTAVGKPLEPSDSLVEIVDLTTVEAVARVPEHFASKLKQGLKAHIRLPGFPDKVFEAELAHLGASADAQSNTLEAAFHVPNPDKLMRPGMRAEFDIVVSHRESVVAVPRSALQGEPSNRHVFVKDFDLPNAFIRTPVVTGQQNARFVEIVGGLLPADEVVVNGAYSLGFAGGGTLSLKDALDAAHGHEHNEDGSEMTAAQKAAASHASGSSDEHEHGEGGSPFWMIVSGVLFLLLVISQILHRRAVRAPNPRVITRKPETV